MLRIEFEFDSAELTGPARQNLDDVAAAINDPQPALARVALEGPAGALAGWRLQVGPVGIGGLGSNFQGESR